MILIRGLATSYIRRNARDALVRGKTPKRERHRFGVRLQPDEALKKPVPHARLAATVQ